METVSRKYSADFHYNISISNYAKYNDFVCGYSNYSFFGGHPNDSNVSDVYCHRIYYIAAGNYLCRVNHSSTKLCRDQRCINGLGIQQGRHEIPYKAGLQRYEQPKQHDFGRSGLEGFYRLQKL